MVYIDCKREKLPENRQDKNKGRRMSVLLAASRLIDSISQFMGKISEYMVLFCCLISAGNAIVRYAFNYSSNGWLEIQWYLFAFVVMLGASHALRNNEHVRVDLIYGSVSDRAKIWIDIVGLILFLLPACVFLAWICWPFFALSYQQGEISGNAGGLIRWPVKLILVAGFALLSLQGVSELIKRIAAVTGHISIDTKYEKPLQ
ncbi:TRAP-type mannitol/chloroaromatic compound transport system permease small subunit [Rhizobium leguminosarum]|nr:tripartite ATP-independent periplasmic transporter, DctQ family [Rhizobium leguminosarum bv. viciae]